MLVGFTDGISEAMTSEDEEWGEERLLEELQRASGYCPRGIIAAVFAGADGFTRDAVQYDDMTVVVMKVGAG